MHLKSLLLGVAAALSFASCAFASTSTPDGIGGAPADIVYGISQYETLIIKGADISAQTGDEVGFTQPKIDKVAITDTLLGPQLAEGSDRLGKKPNLLNLAGGEQVILGPQLATNIYGGCIDASTSLEGCGGAKILNL